MPQSGVTLLFSLRALWSLGPRISVEVHLFPKVPPCPRSRPPHSHEPDISSRRGGIGKAGVPCPNAWGIRRTFPYQRRERFWCVRLGESGLEWRGVLWGLSFPPPNPGPRIRKGVLAAPQAGRDCLVASHRGLHPPSFCCLSTGSVAGCLYECGCSPPRAQTPALIAETGQTAGVGWSTLQCG